MTGLSTPPERSCLFVVDDDEDTRSNLRDILEMDGYRVVEAGCAKELFALPDWDSVSLILLDRKLPDGTPEKILPEIRSRAPHASVFIVTGFSDVNAAVSALRLGAADYIIKPVNPDALRASIRRELGHQRSELQLNALFENALDGMVIFDRDEIVIDANPAACALLGAPRTEIVGDSLKSVIAESSRPNATAVFSRKNPRGERRLRCRNGTEIEVEHQVTFDFCPGLNVLALRDVTERKRSEQRALQAERLAAIGETMAALAHESRNALQRSFACLEMLALEVEDRPAALDLLQRARKAQEQLRQLYEEVRQWAAPINVQCQAADLADIWREAWQQVMQTQKTKRIKLHETIECNTQCLVDPAKIGQVFRNVFENAVEVSADQGVVELSCSSASSDKVTITICDHGPGLTREQLARAFEPFFTTKTKGTGLGLAITKRIVQAHQGNISASSPSGACFEFTLPRVTP